MANQRDQSKSLLGFHAEPHEAATLKLTAKRRLTTIAGLFRQLAGGSIIHPVFDLMSAQDTREFFGNKTFKKLIATGRLLPCLGEGARGFFDPKAVATLSQTLEIEDQQNNPEIKKKLQKKARLVKKNQKAIARLGEQGITVSRHQVTASDILGWLSSGMAESAIVREVWAWREAGRPRQFVTPRTGEPFDREKLDPHGILELLEKAFLNHRLESQLLDDQATHERKRGNRIVSDQLRIRAKAKAELADRVEAKLNELRAKPDGRADRFFTIDGIHEELLDPEGFSLHYET